MVTGTTNQLNSIHFTPGGNGWAVGNNGIVLYSTDYGVSWNQLLLPDAGVGNLRAVYAIDEQRVFTVTEYGQVWQSTQGGQSIDPKQGGWELIYTIPQSLYGLSGSNDNNPRVWTVGTNGLFQQVFGPDEPPPTQQTSGFSATFQDVAVVSNEIGWIVGDDGVLLNTGNHGQTWDDERDELEHADGNDPHDLHGIDFVGTDLAWIVGEGCSIFRTTDAGDNWTSEHLAAEFDPVGDSANWPPLSDVEFISPNRGIAVGSNATILITIPDTALGDDDDSSGDDDDANVPAGCDQDGDGFAATGGMGSGGVPCGGSDCNDAAFAINPSATEVCDGQDNNCNQIIDEGFDVDNDGYTTCGADIDCDDNNEFANPGATEVCDGIDNNCDSLTDEGLGCGPIDSDGDGFTISDGDCDDFDDTINPMVWDGFGADDLNCDTDPHFTLAASSAIGITATCMSPLLDFVVGSGAGDFNNDGIDDLVFGNPQRSGASCNSSTSDGAGVVLTLPGFTAGTPPQSLPIGSSFGLEIASDSMFDGSASAQAGYSIATGHLDLSTTGPADLLIGAPGFVMTDANSDESPEQGAVYLKRGGQPLTDCALGQAGCADFTFYGGATGDQAGFTVAFAGDITADGYQEILIGAPGYSNETGQFYLIDGKTIFDAMLQNGTDDLECTGPLDQTEGNCLNLNDLGGEHARITGAAQGDKLGEIPAAFGELNDSSANIPDLVLSSYTANSGTGLVTVFYGDQITSGSVPNVVLHIGDGGNNVTTIGETTNARDNLIGDPTVIPKEFGRAVAVIPDLPHDTDSLSELAIADPAAGDDDGEVLIVTSTRLDSLSSLGLSASVIDGGTGGTAVITIEGAAHSQERFGEALAAGEVDGDQKGDLVICAPYGGPGYSPGSGSYETGAGVARLYLGNSMEVYTLLQPNNADAAFLGELAAQPNHVGERFCSSVNMSVDADDNGLPELIVGAPGWDDLPGGGEIGKAYVFINPYNPTSP